MSKSRKLFACLVCLVAAVFCLVSCAETEPTDNINAEETALQQAQEVLNKLVWDAEDRKAIVESISLATSNKNYPYVTISWSSSQPDVISNTGTVVRPEYEDERAYLDGDNKVVKVVLTAEVVASYSIEEEIEKGDGSVSTISVTKKTEPISKQFEFTVLCLPSAGDMATGTIKEVKDAAWNHYYVEQGINKTLTTNKETFFNVKVTGVVTAKLVGDTRGFMIHDGSDGIYVYATNSDVNVGDTVTVVGGSYVYYGAIQIAEEVTVTKVDPIEGVVPGEFVEVTADEWEKSHAPNAEGVYTDEVIGRFGGSLIKVLGILTQQDAPGGSSDKYCVVDAFTGEPVWIYYKSYSEEMQAKLDANVGEYVALEGVSYDRDSRINKTEVLWTGNLEVREAPEVSDEEQVVVALSQIALQDEYVEDFDLSSLGVWEIVSGTGIEIVDGVAKVTRGSSDQTVVLKVTVTIGSASDSKEFTVKIPSAVVETITIAEALELCGNQKDVYTSEKYCIEGTVVEIANETYGNLYIEDATGKLYVYGVYIEGSKYGDYKDAKFAVGDYVVLKGVLGYYNDTQMKNADLVAWEPATKYETVSNAEANELGVANPAGTSDKYTIKGYVTSVTNTTYGNLYVKDIYGNEIYVYGVYSADGSVRYDALENAPKAGDFVVLTGVLMAYNGAPQMKNGWLLQLNDVDYNAEPHEHEYVDGKCACGAEDPNYVKPDGPAADSTITIEQAIALGVANPNYTADKYYVEGTVTGLYNTTYGNFYITDGTNEICVYGLYSADGSVRYDAMEVKPVDGDKVKIYGVIGAYNGNAQFKNAWLIEIVAGGSTEEKPVDPENKEVTIAEALELADGTEVVIKATVHSVDGAWNTDYNNMNVTLKDATGTLYVYRLGTQVKLGDIVTVTGVMATYYESRQIAQGATAEITGHDDSYDVVVENAATITFDSTSKRTSFSTEQQVWEENGIKVTNDKASSSSSVADYSNPARFYKGSNVTVEAEKGMKKIVIKTSGGSKYNLSDTTAIEGATVTYDGSVCTIEFTEAVNSFTIASLGNQIRVSTITVEFAE